MKNISFETHPILKIFSKSFDLSNNINLEILLNTTSDVAKSIGNHIKNKEEYLENLDIVSFTAMEKITDLNKTFHDSGVIKDYFSSAKDVKGICILNEGVFVYHLEGTNSGNDIAKVLFLYSLGNNICIYDSPIEDIYKSSFNFQDSKLMLTFLINYCVFKKYAPVETKVFTSSLKSTKNKTNRFNKLPFNLNFIDITWFTTLIKSGEFSVSGHWRLQPYKEGKKLIWIKEFKKSGYTRSAKILDNDSNI